MVDYNKLKENYIKKIIKECPDMKVIYINLNENKRWQTEKIITELTKEEREEFNLRKQFFDEVVLDVEESYRLSDIQSKLDERKWSYEVWSTGSRGIHISIKFANLADKDLELRNRIRKYIITSFRTDESLAKESQWLALEWSKHFKTGTEKKLIDSINSNEKNLISKDIIEYCEKDIENQQKRQIENKKIFENAHQKDPYLKYVLEHTIERGERNNILFKNLSILLVQSGLTREEIIPYVQNIVVNCPGKSEGEMWGWVDKALNGEMVDYNKSELIQWSLNYGHPVLYKLESDEDITDYLSIKQLWDELWNHKIACQPVWKDLCLYNLLGTVLNEKEEDYRVHVIFSSYSTTGKDEGVNIVNDALERLGYNTKRPAEVTDRTLVGAVNPIAVEYNTKNGLTIDEPIKGNKSYKEPVEKGWLEDSNWIAFSEAESIFKPGLHNKHVQIILRQAMDKSRRVEKGVAGHSIPVTTNTSFILTTYKMDNLINSILSNGLFQRAIFYLKNITDKEHKEIRKHINVSRFNSKVKLTFNEEKYTMKLLEKLRNMKKWYEENKKNIVFEEGSDIFVEDLWKVAEDNYSDFMDIDKEILNSMIRRESVHLYKLCILNTICREKTIVTKKTIRECYDIIMECIDSIKSLIMSQDKDKKMKFSLLKLLATNGSMSKMTIHYELENRFKIKSTNIRTNFIKKLVDLEFVTSFESGRNTMIMITEKGRDWVDGN